MERDEQLEILKGKVHNKNLIKHMIATEAVMGALAEKLGEDRALWETSGLLHDVDYDETKDEPFVHGLKGASYLEELGFPEEVVQAVRSHPGHIPRTSKMDLCLYAADPLTGLIVAAALMHPDKKLEGLDADFVMRRFSEKRFAAGADREQIKECSKVGLELEEFVEIALDAMKKVSDDLGL
jgi:putative nucleotidyltransferase with HDIG domain